MITKKKRNDIIEMRLPAHKVALSNPGKIN